MKQDITSKTGNAPIVRQGHTTDTLFGTNPAATVRGEKPCTDIKRP